MSRSPGRMVGAMGRAEEGSGCWRGTVQVHEEGSERWTGQSRVTRWKVLGMMVLTVPSSGTDLRPLSRALKMVQTDRQNHLVTWPPALSTTQPVFLVKPKLAAGLWLPCTGSRPCVRPGRRRLFGSDLEDAAQELRPRSQPRARGTTAFVSCGFA